MIFLQPNKHGHPALRIPTRWRALPLFVLLGFITGLASAWLPIELASKGIVIAGTPVNQWVSDDGLWLHSPFKALGFEQYFLGAKQVMTSPTPVPIEDLPAWVVIPDQPPVIGLFSFNAGGWPLRCLSGTLGWSGLTGLKPLTCSAIHRKDFIALPLSPLPVGIAVNTLTWAALWWVGVSLLIIIRRTKRQWAGLCPECAYQLRADTKCSECGWTHTTPIHLSDT